MKRTYWIITTIYLIAILLTDLFGTYLDALFFEEARPLSFLLLSVLYIGIFWVFVSRRKPVTLTEEEMQAPVAERQEFSNAQNQPHWSVFILSFFAFFVLMYVYIFIYFGMYDIFRGAPFMETVIKYHRIYLTLFKSITWWVVLAAITAFCIIGYKRPLSNKYILDGNTLIIQEHFLFRKAEEIHIPLDTIDEVYLRHIGSYYGSLYLNIQGIKRRLLVDDKNSLALGKAILQHKHALSEQK